MPRKISPELRRIYHANYVAKPGNKPKLRCRELCAYAIKSGKLTRRPCEKCGTAKSEAHHEDYSKPFDVQWLCRQCHAALHCGSFRSTYARSHCKRGHELTGHNLMIVSPGWKKCRQCQYDNKNALKRQRRAETTQHQNT